MPYDYGKGLSGAGSGALTGAMIGSAVPVIGTGVGAAIGGLAGLAGGITKSDPNAGYNSALQNLNLQMMQQRVNAGTDLSNYAKTGNYNDIYQAGTPYGKATGSYTPTAAEGQGQLMLNNLLQAGAPELNTLANQEYKDLLASDKYDPFSTSNNALWKPYLDEIYKQQGVQADKLDQNLAMTGDFYSSNRADQQRELGQNTQDQTNQLLAGLGQQYQDRRLTGAQTAANLGAQQQAMELEKIQASRQYGDLERILQDQQAKEQYNEWLRARSEYGDVINTAKTLYGGGSVGGTGIQQQTYNPYSGVSSAMNSLGSLASSSYLGSILGGGAPEVPQVQSTPLYNTNGVASYNYSPIR